MQINLEPETRAIIGRLKALLEHQELRGYIVGGFLRDLVMGRQVRDLDIALDGDVVAFGREFACELEAKPVLLDNTNGTMRLILPETGANCRQIDVSSTHGDLGSDLALRDFTLNAMACDIVAHSWDAPNTLAIDIMDPLDGLKDIRARLVRATGSNVFRHDAIRLLRAVRLASELGFAIDDATEGLIKRDAHLIQGEAGERVREELLRILKQGNTDTTILYMQELNLITAVIPELAPSVGLEQHSDHQWNVFEHSVRSMAAMDFLLRCGSWSHASINVLEDVSWDECLADHFQAPVSSASNHRELDKFAALLHDIAKPQTQTISPSGKLRFYGHPQEGALVVEKILERLRFSTGEKRLVTTVVRHHLRPVQLGGDDALPSKRAVYHLIRDLGEALPDTLFFSLADHLATRGDRLDLTNWRHHANIVNYVMAESAHTNSAPPTKLLNGYDLQRELGLKPGLRLGMVLAELREAQAVGEISNRDEALRYAIGLLNEQG